MIDDRRRRIVHRPSSVVHRRNQKDISTRLGFKRMPLVEIMPYDPRWPAEFAAIGAALRGALGDLALRIDHIGSTSVPSLAAKDRIDVQLTVADFARFELVEAALKRLGYTFVPGNLNDH